MLVLGLLTRITDAYTIDYWDCSNPSQVRQYALSSLCAENPMDNQPQSGQENYSLLQFSNEKVLKGISCEVKKSEFFAYCGSFSHEKIAAIPHIEWGVPVSSRMCDSISSTRTFTTGDGSPNHPVTMNGETIILVDEVGAIISKDNMVA